MAELPYDGIAVRLGAREWIVPSLNLRQLKRLSPKFALLSKVGVAMADEQIDALIEIAHAALSRNYPDLMPEDVAELVDLGNAGALVKAIVGASGLVRTPTDKRVGLQPPGEAEAGSASSGTS